MVGRRMVKTVGSEIRPRQPFFIPDGTLPRRGALDLRGGVDGGHRAIGR